MLQSINQLIGKRLRAADGEIGKVKDFYFEERTWAIRYLLVDTGQWLPGRQVLLSPHSMGEFEHDEPWGTNLSRKKIEHCPPLATHEPLTRGYEEKYYHHYGWSRYWHGQGLWGSNDIPTSGTPARLHPESEHAYAILHSTVAIGGYRLRAADGMVGLIYDFLMNPETWVIRQLTVKSGHWFSGGKVEIATSVIDEIRDENSILTTNLSKKEVEQNTAPELMVE
jgi:hypothetical protein